MLKLDLLEYEGGQIDPPPPPPSQQKLPLKSPALLGLSILSDANLDSKIIATKGKDGGI